MDELTSRTVTDLPADPASVWEALTTPEGVAAWLGEGSDLPPEEGAPLDVADVETGIRRHGRVETVEPGRRLGFVWWPADEDEPPSSHDHDGGADGSAASRVAIELVPHDGGTALVISESPLGSAPTAHASIERTVAGTWGWRFTTVELDAHRLAAVVGIC